MVKPSKPSVSAALLDRKKAISAARTSNSTAGWKGVSTDHWKRVSMLFATPCKGRSEEP